MRIISQEIAEALYGDSLAYHIIVFPSRSGIFDELHFLEENLQ